MKSTIETFNGITILRVESDLETVAEALEFELELNDRLNEGVTALAIDFSKTTFISSPIIAVINFISKKLKKVHGTLHLFGIRPDLEIYFDTLGIDSILALYQTEDDFRRTLEAGPRQLQETK
jgi:anti-anti-sigma factor